jgi:hypothetical protein
METQLTQEEQTFLNTLKKLLKSKDIQLGVNIEPRYAEKGSGRWNVTQTFAMIGGEWITLEDGNVEIIEGH